MPVTPNGAPPEAYGQAAQAAQSGAGTFSEPQPPRTIPKQIQVGNGFYSTIQVDNPAWVAWKQRKDTFDKQMAANREAAAQQPVQQGYQGVIEQAQKPEASGFKDDQSFLAQYLRAQANGTAGPSAAQQQLRAGVDTAQRQAIGLAAAARPGQGGSAMRAAQQGNSQLGLQAAQQATMLRAQEQQQAQALLAQLTGQGRGQDQNYTQTALQAQLGALGGLTNLYGMNLQNQQFQQQLQQAIQLARMGQPSTLERILGAGAGLLPMFLGIG